MFRAFDITLLIPGLPCGPRTLERQALGGSESAGLYMARALSRAGANVHVFANGVETSTLDDGIAYSDLKTWPEFADASPHDICIAQRSVDLLKVQPNSRLNVLWCHDLALGRQARQVHSASWNVDKIIVLSQYMRQQYMKAWGLDEQSFLLSRNGIDTQLIESINNEEIERTPTRLVFAARPERGLDVLLRDIFPRLLQVNDSFEIHLAGYDSLASSDWSDFYSECRRMTAAFGARITHHGALSKPDLYRLYRSSGAYVYPTPSTSFPSFREVSCISAMEAQALGLPIVTTANGALTETIAAGAGRFVDAGLPSSEYADSFVRAICELTLNGESHSRASRIGQQHGLSLDWSRVAEQWLSDFRSLIIERNDCPTRLLRHLHRTSDIVVAKHLLTRQPELDEPRISGRATRLFDEWSFMHDEDGYRKQYEKISAIAHEPEHDAREELRFGVLKDWLAERQEFKEILDYGCAHGGYALGLAKELPHLRIRGCDIDRRTVEVAQRAAAREKIDSVRFSVWTHEDRAQFETDGFDCAILQEVLEHVPKPWEVLQSVENQVRLGGGVYITVPFGPWELESYRSSELRCHIWHFDAHDIRDMLGSKPNLEIRSVFARRGTINGARLGWWVVTYSADHSPIGTIDFDRHAWLQNPSESLSVGIIAGPQSEDLLHWNLKSIEAIADQIVIVDCKMSEEARRIAAQYPIRIVEGVDISETGFDEARNIALRESECDWFLWIDVDERLVGPDHLAKYLRRNRLSAYAVAQHNFACDEHLGADYPLRLFRRLPKSGKVPRFWGSIHEHPETELNQGLGPSLALSDVRIAHVGYINENARRERFHRNWPLLQLDINKYPDRIMQKLFVMRELSHLCRFTLSANGGVVDAHSQDRCRQIVDLYRTYFKATRGPSHTAALEYYSEALTMLGEGFEALVNVEAAKYDVKSGDPRRIRFASSDDYAAELVRSAKERAEEFDSPEW